MSDSDPEWTLLRSQLADDQWDFRTIEGLARATKLPESAIRSSLKKHGSEIRVAHIPDRQGRLLYTLAERPMKWQERFANIVAFIAKSA